MTDVNVNTNVSIRCKVEFIRVNPYWKLPWIYRQALHLWGKAPYQDMTKPYRERVTIVPLVKMKYILKMIIQVIKEK